MPPSVVAELAGRMVGAAETMRSELDEREAREQDPDRLAALYVLDHGLAQWRRQVLRLRVLADVTDYQGGGDPVALRAVIRIAEGMIPHYRRLRVAEVQDVRIVAGFVDDLALLLAEVCDNATRFGAPVADIYGYRTSAGRGICVTVQDRGRGIDPRLLQQINSWLAARPWPVSTMATGRTGLEVVHRLAYRHGWQVVLSGLGDQPGVQAAVYLPETMLHQDTHGPSAGTAPASPPAPPAHASASGLPQRIRGVPPVPAPGAAPRAVDQTQLAAGLDAFGAAWTPAPSDTPSDPAQEKM
jgi:signal transduction histidine kinase